MKKTLIALALIAAIGLPTSTSAQHHRHTPRTAVAAAQQDTSGIEAFSDTTDTTSNVDTTASASGRHYQLSFDDQDLNDFFNQNGDSISDMVAVVFIVLIVCLFSPAVIVGLICYFIYKSRKQKLQLAEMAMKSGQPIPQKVMKKPLSTHEDYRKAGIMKIAVGLGITVLGWIGTGSNVIASIGLLVAIYGGGQLFIAQTSSGDKPVKDKDEDVSFEDKPSTSDYEEK